MSEKRIYTGRNIINEKTNTLLNYNSFIFNYF